MTMKAGGRRGLAAGLLTAVLSMTALTATAHAQPYLLGPEDKLKIRVYDWRASSSEVHEWAALTGEFVVGASGTISLPLIGEVPAAGKSTGDLSVLIGERLRASIGLSNRPDASVEVSTYRPFFIIGMVTTPGQYAYKPGLTVLQAVSTAGGILRVSDLGLLGYQRETMVSRGDLRTLAVERLSLLARQARLDAELHGDDGVVFPKDLTGRADTPQIAQMMREEQLLFEARRQALQSQEEAIAQTKRLLSSEIEALKAKSANLQRQLELAKQELDNVNSLVSKGFATASRKLELDRNVSQFESSRLDFDLTILRAQQDLSKADRDIVDLRNKRRNDILTEVSDVRTKISLNAEKTSTTQGLIYNSEVVAPQIVMSQTGSADSKLTYAIVRRAGEQTLTIAADEADPVYPGDVIRVSRTGTSPAASEVVPGVVPGVTASAQP